MASRSREDPLARISELERRLEEAEDTLRAIRGGEVDAIVATGPGGDRVYTLKGADEAYRIMVQGMAEGALTLTPGGLILFSNQQFALMTGHPLEQVVGAELHDFIAPEDLETVAALLTGTGGRKAEATLATAHGRSVPVYLSVEEMVVEEEACLCLIVTDLSEQKRSQEIATAELLARSILEQAAEPILVTDADGNIRRASRAAEHLAGTPLLRKCFDEVFGITLISGALCFFKDILETVSSNRPVRNLEASVLLPDGRRMEVLLSAATLSHQGAGAPGCVLTLIDITERKHRELTQENAERAARESQATLQSFYDSSSFLMGVAELDGDGITVVYGNKAATEFFRCETGSRTELQRDMALAVTATANSVWREYYRRSLITGVAVRFEYEHSDDRGSRWLSVAVNYLEDGSDKKRRFSFVGEDVTEKRNAVDLLRHTNDELRRANGDLEQFAYSASHDLQEPLRQVAMFSQLLERDYSLQLDGAGLQYLSYCVQGARRIQKMLNDLLDYSKSGTVEAGLPELVDTNEVLRAVRENLATAITESGATLKVGQLPQIHFPPVALALVFQNLVSNALKYAGETAPEVTVSAVREEKAWRFSVRDNGLGIKDEFHKEIFGLFKRLHTQARYPGTGMGLAICQKIVERHGGRIWVESSLGEGSVFLFTLPVARSAAQYVA